MKKETSQWRKPGKAIFIEVQLSDAPPLMKSLQCTKIGTEIG